MPTARDIAAALERLAPLRTGIAGDELGFVFGDPFREIRGVACLWQVETQSLRRCVDLELDFLLCHEGLWMPAQESPWYDAPAPAPVFSDEARRALLERHALVVYRSHSNWDALARDGVPDQALAALGLHGLREIARRKFYSVQELPAPLTADQLAKHARRGLGFTGCRVFGAKDKLVRRFAFLIGGFGENQYHLPQLARELGAEAIVIGEMSEFIVVACLEMGLPVIETLHSVSENPGIRRQAALLAREFPGLPVEYVPSGAAAFGA